MKIEIPEIHIDQVAGQRWCWQVKDGASGTHEDSFKNALRVALNSVINEMTSPKPTYDAAHFVELPAQ